MISLTFFFYANLYILFPVFLLLALPCTTVVNLATHGILESHAGTANEIESILVGDSSTEKTCIESMQRQIESDKTTCDPTSTSL